jgi:hypothetical protein
MDLLGRTRSTHYPTYSRTCHPGFWSLLIDIYKPRILCCPPHWWKRLQIWAETGAVNEYYYLHSRSLYLAFVRESQLLCGQLVSVGYRWSRYDHGTRISKFHELYYQAVACLAIDTRLLCHIVKRHLVFRKAISEETRANFSTYSKQEWRKIIHCWHYMVTPIKDKLDTLFSFLKSHTKSKILVFISTCKQVRFIYEVISKLKPGMPLFELQGR